MFLLLARSAWGPTLWLTTLACRFAYRNANLQTLVLAPLALVLMLLPSVFDPPEPERSRDSDFLSYSAPEMPPFQVPPPLVNHQFAPPLKPASTDFNSYLRPTP